MLYNAQVSTEIVRRVTEVDSDFSTVPISLPLPGHGYKRLACHASRQLQHTYILVITHHKPVWQLQHTFWSFLYSNLL